MRDRDSMGQRRVPIAELRTHLDKSMDAWEPSDNLAYGAEIYIIMEVSKKRARSNGRAMRKWRNWYTRQIWDLVPERAWGFESPFRTI